MSSYSVLSCLLVSSEWQWDSISTPWEDRRLWEGSLQWYGALYWSFAYAVGAIVEVALMLQPLTAEQRHQPLLFPLKPLGREKQFALPFSYFLALYHCRFLHYYVALSHLCHFLQEGVQSALLHALQDSRHYSHLEQRQDWHFPSLEEPLALRLLLPSVLYDLFARSKFVQTQISPGILFRHKFPTFV